MNVSDSTSELLDNILSLSELNYLSDLPNAESRCGVRLAMERIDPDGYSIAAWNGAASYILKSACAFASAREAASYLIAALS